MRDMATIVFLFGGKTLRGLLGDVRWRWSSDEQDAAQRRRHEDEDHQIEVRRKVLELDRDFPDATARLPELEADAAPRPELPPPDAAD
jgi:hypothetical protein